MSSESGWATNTKTTKSDSPCVGICVLDEDGIRCIGCGRTIEEITSEDAVLPRINQFADDLKITRSQAVKLINEGRRRSDGGSETVEKNMGKK